MNTRFAQQHPMSLLVAEDNDANQKVIAKMLQRLGYDHVTLVSNGKEAVEKVKKKCLFLFFSWGVFLLTFFLVQWSMQKFDVIFMDINMPVMGMYAHLLTFLLLCKNNILLTNTIYRVQSIFTFSRIFLLLFLIPF